MKKMIEKWKAIPNSVKSSIAFILSSFFLKGISFITTPIFTRLMDTAQYGIIATYTSWVSIIDVFALLGLTSAGVFNVGLNDYKDSRNQYISSILTLCNLSTLAVFGVLAVLKIVVGESFLLPTNLIVLMFLHFLFNPAHVFWITRQKYEYKYKLAFVITIGSTLISQTVSILGVLNTGNATAAYTKLWCAELASFVFVIPLYVLAFWRGRTFINGSIWKQTLKFALPLIPHYLAQHVMSGSNRIMLSDMDSESAAGIYSVVANISMIASLIWNAINASLVAFTFENLSRKEYKRINNTACILMLGFGVACFGICLIAPEVLKILAPPEYYQGVYAIPAIAGVAFLSALYNLFANIEFFNKKSKYITAATIVAMVINVVLNWIVIPKYSFLGVAYASLVSYAVLVFMHYVGYRKSSPDKVYNSKLLLLITVVCIGACILCNLLYTNNTLRYWIAAVIAVLAISNRGFIVRKIKEMHE